MIDLYSSPNIIRVMEKMR